MKEIYKVAGLEIINDRFLMVRKKGKDIWTNLGGKPEGNENDEETLSREVAEELGCEIEILEKIGEFKNKAALDDAILHLSVYLIKLAGKPRISDEELEEFKYIGKDDIEKGIKLPLSITEQLIPELNRRSLISWRIHG